MTSLKAIFLLSILFYSCANIVAPTGGEKDVDAPKLLTINEIYGEKNEKLIKFQLTFDEYLQLHNWENNFYISPPINTVPIKKIKNTTLTISIEDSLSRNTTYYLSLSNCIKDLNEGNIIDSLSFIFGNNILMDTFSLNGSLRDAYSLNVIENAWVMLFSKKRNDTVIFKKTPDYISKTDKNGYFYFPNLNNYSYKIVALTGDDFFYNQNEYIGFYDSLVNAKKDSSIRLFLFSPEKNDTTINDTTLLDKISNTKLDTINANELIAGNLILNTKRSGSVLFQLLQNEEIIYSFSFNNLPFLLYDLQPGSYKLKCILDTNKDGKWTVGNWEKKIQSEKVFNYPEEIIIRSNWDLELDWDLD